MNPQQGDSDGTVRVRLADGREVPLRLRSEDWQRDYRGARLAPGAEREERETLAALVARADGPVGRYRNTDRNAGVYRLGAHLRVGMQEATEAGADDEEAIERAVEAERVLEGAGTDALQAAYRMVPVEHALKRYHPDFDRRNRDKRIDLLMRGAEHFDKAWWALDAFGESVQVESPEGRPSGRPRKKVDDPQRAVRAVELRDALSLPYRQIGEVLGMPLSRTDRDKGSHGAVRGMIERTRQPLTDSLGGEAGYRRHIDAIKPGLERWHALSDRERGVRNMIEIGAAVTGQPLEVVEARRPDIERLRDEHFSEDDHPRT